MDAIDANKCKSINSKGPIWSDKLGYNYKIYNYIVLIYNKLGLKLIEKLTFLLDSFKEEDTIKQLISDFLISDYPMDFYVIIQSIFFFLCDNTIN